MAHCLLARPSWVLLDESMAHMSAASRAELYELLADQLVKGLPTSEAPQVMETQRSLKLLQTP